MNSDSLEASEIHAAANATAPRVTLADIKANIAAEAYFTAGQAGAALGLPMHESTNLLTLCILTTHSGYTIIGTSAPASPENFDAEKGRAFAYEDAVKQLWPLMGYALRAALATPIQQAA